MCVCAVVHSAHCTTAPKLSSETNISYLPSRIMYAEPVLYIDDSFHVLSSSHQCSHEPSHSNETKPQYCGVIRKNRVSGKSIGSREFARDLFVIRCSCRVFSIALCTHAQRTHKLQRGRYPNAQR